MAAYVERPNKGHPNASQKVALPFVNFIIEKGKKG